MTDVKVRQAEVTIRTVKLSKSLLKQAKKLKSIPTAFRVPDEQAVNMAVGASVKLRPEIVVGWIHGSVLGVGYTRYVLFQHDGDLFLFDWPDFNPAACGCPEARQLYIG